MKIKVYYREDNELLEGVNFKFDNPCIYNGCIRYFLSHGEIEKLHDGQMVAHHNIIIIPCQEEE